MIQIWQVPSECGPSNLVVLGLGLDFEHLSGEWHFMLLWIVVCDSYIIIPFIFRIHLFFLHGPLMAVVFPVTNTLFLPGEVATYWIEHVLLLGIPIWCLKCTDLTVPSKTKWLDYLGWGLMAYGIWGLFHFIFLQPLAILTYANLNSLLCPAITDPFYGKNYRSYGIVHQFFITLVFGCVSNFIGNEEKVMLDWKCKQKIV